MGELGDRSGAIGEDEQGAVASRGAVAERISVALGQGYIDGPIRAFPDLSDSSGPRLVGIENYLVKVFEFTPTIDRIRDDYQCGRGWNSLKCVVPLLVGAGFDPFGIKPRWIDAGVVIVVVYADVGHHAVPNQRTMVRID